VIAAARLRKGSTNSARGAHRFVTDALITARKAGASGVLVLQADSAYYGHDFIAAALRQGACFSITARPDKAVREAISTISNDAWTTITYTDAIFDEDSQRWISDADVAEIDYTAFTSKPKTKHIKAKLIVHGVKDMNPDNQSELFTAYRYHAVFTNSPLPMLAAEKAHRAHAIVEQIIADLNNGPLAHPPSGHVWANSAWLVCAAIAFNLTRAAGTLASVFHACATTGTIRTQLINVPGRLARCARRLTLHLPTGRPWQKAWEQLNHNCQQPTARGLTHPPVPQDQTGEHRGEQPARWRMALRAVPVSVRGIPGSAPDRRRGRRQHPAQG
jgi:hypothetical protein